MLSLKKVEAFLEHLTIQGSYSRNTLSSYKRDLTIYLCFLKQKKNLSEFYEYIDTQGFKPRSKARIISSVRSYLRFLEQQGQRTQLKELTPVPIKKNLPKLVSLNDFNQIIKSATVSDEHKTIRNHVTLLLMFGLGCRISECIQLNLQDFNELDHSMIITGKKQKQRLLPLTDEVFQQLTNYIYNHRSFLVTSKTHSILINNRGKRPSRVDVWRWLLLWSKKAGFGDVKSPHQFRHGFATSLLENGADLRSIQCLLGHSSIQTTQIYTSVKQKHLKNTIQKHHPLSGLKKIN